MNNRELSVLVNILNANCIHFPQNAANVISANKNSNEYQTKLEEFNKNWEAILQTANLLNEFLNLPAGEINQKTDDN